MLAIMHISIVLRAVGKLFTLLDVLEELWESLREQLCGVIITSSLDRGTPTLASCACSNSDSLPMPRFSVMPLGCGGRSMRGVGGIRYDLPPA